MAAARPGGEAACLWPRESGVDSLLTPGLAVWMVLLLADGSSSIRRSTRT